MGIIAVIEAGVTFYRAWILTLLWGWFVVPFFGLPALGFGYAVGFLVLVSVTRVHRHSISDPKKDESDEVRQERITRDRGWALVDSVVGASYILAWGYLVQCFLMV
jgi:hypothetical protein